jgi:uncharacterized lipoprotein YmbA
MPKAHILTVIRWFALLSVCALVSACLGKKVSEVNYYSLLSMQQMGVAAETAAGPDLSIGIGPISVPEVLKRSQLVTRDARNLYRFDEYHRWAGSIEQDIAYVLGDNLGYLLGQEKIAFFPWMQNFKPTHRVVIEIIEFDGQLGGEAILNVRWAIADPAGEIDLIREQSVYRQPVDGDDYAGLVRAQSQLIAMLSREIAAALETLAAAK